MARRSMILMAVSALALAALTVVASGRTVPAVGGYTYPSDTACFTESWGSMLNQCSTTRTLFIPVHTDTLCTVGSSWHVVAQSASSASNVCCRTIGMENNGSITTTEYRCLSQFGAPQDFLVYGAMPYSKRTFFVCTVGPGARVLGVDWDPNGSC